MSKQIRRHSADQIVKMLRDADVRLTKRILELVRQRPRWGYRRIEVLLRNEGQELNMKRCGRTCPMETDWLCLLLALRASMMIRCLVRSRRPRTIAVESDRDKALCNAVNLMSTSP